MEYIVPDFTRFEKEMRLAFTYYNPSCFFKLVIATGKENSLGIPRAVNKNSEFSTLKNKVDISYKQIIDFFTEYSKVTNITKYAVVTERTFRESFGLLSKETLDAADNGAPQYSPYSINPNIEGIYLLCSIQSNHGNREPCYIIIYITRSQLQDVHRIHIYATSTEINCFLLKPNTDQDKCEIITIKCDTLTANDDIEEQDITALEEEKATIEKQMKVYFERLDEIEKELAKKKNDTSTKSYYSYFGQ